MNTAGMAGAGVGGERGAQGSHGGYGGKAARALGARTCPGPEGNDYWPRHYAAAIRALRPDLREVAIARVPAWYRAWVVEYLAAWQQKNSRNGVCTFQKED